MEDIYGMNLRCTFHKVNNVTTVNATNTNSTTTTTTQVD